MPRDTQILPMECFSDTQTKNERKRSGEEVRDILVIVREKQISREINRSKRNGEKERKRGGEADGNRG